jgi:hypothetical protein
MRWGEDAGLLEESPRELFGWSFSSESFSGRSLSGCWGVSEEDEEGAMSGLGG